MTWFVIIVCFAIFFYLGMIICFPKKMFDRYFAPLFIRIIKTPAKKAKDDSHYFGVISFGILTQLGLLLIVIKCSISSFEDDLYFIWDDFND